ncbi:MAG: hypothetical protein KJ606_12705 [Chloroflexi bacterium]|nr:hypothetical protein [Chloroflexota bacterium]
MSASIAWVTKRLDFAWHAQYTLPAATGLVKKPDQVAATCHRANTPISENNCERQTVLVEVKNGGLDWMAITDGKADPAPGRQAGCDAGKTF